MVISKRIIVILAILAVSVIIGLKVWLSIEDAPVSMSPEPFTIVVEPRINRSLEIAIVIVVTNGSDLSNYRTALTSIESYSNLHGYQLIVEEDTKYENCSRHADKFFRRHCHTHQLMINELNESSYLLFIDADVGVVNPNTLIDDFIKPEFDIYLYNRFYNWEFAAQYLVKNNERGRNWVKRWAEMEFTQPRPVHGTDSGALHILMMNYLAPETVTGESRMGRLCQSMWERSLNARDLGTMQACTRMVIGERSEFPKEHVKIFPKGRGWARDLWLFMSRWATDDFMLHSIKDEMLKPETIAPHHLNHLLIETEKDKFNIAFPQIPRSLALSFPLLNITKSESGENWWIMDGRLQISNSWREKLFQRLYVMKWQAQYHHLGDTIANFMA